MDGLFYCYKALSVLWLYRLFEEEQIMATGFDPYFHERGRHAPQYKPVSQPEIRTVALRVDEVAYALPTPVHKDGSSQHSPAGPSEPPSPRAPTAPSAERYQRLPHLPSHQPPTATGREYAERKSLERKIKKACAVVGVTVGVAVPAIVVASFLGWTVGGVVGFGIGIGSTVIPSVSIMMTSCFCVLCSQEGKRELKEMGTPTCCRKSRREEAEVPQVRVVERRVENRDPQIEDLEMLLRDPSPVPFSQEHEEAVTDV